MGKSTISMAIFNCKLLVHQRVPTSAPEKIPGTCTSDAGDRRSSVDGLVPRASHTPPRAATQASLCLGKIAWDHPI